MNAMSRGLRPRTPVGEIHPLSPRRSSKLDGQPGWPFGRLTCKGAAKFLHGVRCTTSMQEAHRKDAYAFFSSSLDTRSLRAGRQICRRKRACIQQDRIKAKTI